MSFDPNDFTVEEIYEAYSFAILKALGHETSYRNVDEFQAYYKNTTFDKMTNIRFPRPINHESKSYKEILLEQLEIILYNKKFIGYLKDE